MFLPGAFFLLSTLVEQPDGPLGIVGDDKILAPVAIEVADGESQGAALHLENLESTESEGRGGACVCSLFFGRQGAGQRGDREDHGKGQGFAGAVADHVFNQLF